MSIRTMAILLRKTCARTTAMRALAALLFLGASACTEPPAEREPRDLRAFAVDPAAPPPPIQGGTLLVTSNERAVISDPARAQIHIVDLITGARVATVQLDPGEEPGRAAEDGEGFVHVALRRSGEVVRLEQNAGAVLDRRSVCPSPSGITYDASDDRLYVACTTGELMSLVPHDDSIVAPVQQVAKLPPDLRDVVASDGWLFVSRFRSAEVLVLNKRFGIVNRFRPPEIEPLGAPFARYTARVAWRMRAVPGLGVLLLHQWAGLVPAPHLPEGSWEGGPPNPCNKPVLSGISMVSPGGLHDYRPQLSLAIGGTLVTDFATTADGARIAFSSSGDALTPDGAQVFAGELRFDYPPCRMAEHAVTWPEPYQVTAVGFDAKGRLLAQSREPAVLIRDAPYGDSWLTELSSWSRDDPGHRFFHIKTSAGVACASCHPAGIDDGHVWAFTGTQPRRTQSLAGTLEGTAPFHWEGDMVGLDAILDDVFLDLMRGPELSADSRTAFADYLVSIPAPTTRPHDELAEVGRLMFHDVLSCGSCHSGDKLTNNETVDVGTGGALQVPSLIGLSVRPPYMADGCAETIADRFDPACGGDAHGRVDDLSEGEWIALMTYLESL